MTGNKNNKATKTETTRAADAGASISSENYKATESGFVLVKKTKSGITEIPLSTFTASILTEIRREDEKGDTRVEGFMVEARYRDCVSVFQIPVYDYERPFNDRLLGSCLKVHPLASVMPNKEKHVIAAVKATSAPQVFVKKSGADSKNKENNKPINRKA